MHGYASSFKFFFLAKKNANRSSYRVAISRYQLLDGFFYCCESTFYYLLALMILVSYETSFCYVVCSFKRATIFRYFLTSQIVQSKV